MKNLSKDLRSGALPAKEIPGFLMFLVRHLLALAYWSVLDLIVTGVAMAAEKAVTRIK